MAVITYEQYARSRTDMELKAEARAVYSAIYKVDCFNARDMMLLNALQNELHNRGYRLEETNELVIIK
ncbi:MAG: hypothetical protein PHW33_01720 [Candidatus Portnoybacteria bacterium]|nr:hypothetical protein [Candidatus Portnoybacteria bacterium]